MKLKYEILSTQIVRSGGENNRCGKKRVRKDLVGRILRGKDLGGKIGVGNTWGGVDQGERPVRKN